MLASKFLLLIWLMLIAILQEGSPALAISQESSGKCVPDVGYEQLQNLQEDAFRKRPRIRPWTESDKEWAKLGKWLEYVIEKSGYQGSEAAALLDSLKQKLSVSLPTCYEDPLLHIVLRNLNEKIAKAAKALGFEEVHPPRFGTLPIRQVNARAMPIRDNNEYIVILNSDLFTMAHEMTKLALDSFDITSVNGIGLSKELIADKLRAQPILTERLAVLLHEFIGGDRGEHVFASRAYAHLLSPMVNAIEAFVVAHEYGHVLLKHRPSTDQSSKSGHDNIVLRIERSWKQELEADLLGVQLLNKMIDTDNEVKSQGGSNPEALTLYLRMAPLLFFEFVEVIEDSIYMDEQGGLPPEADDNQIKKVIELAMRALSAEESDQGQSSEDVWDQIGEMKLWSGGSREHPPTWLRRALVGQLLADSVRSPSSEKEIIYGKLVLSLIDHYRALWALLKPEILNSTHSHSDMTPAK